MTVPSTVSEIPYAGDGVTVAFPIPFPFDTSADIVIKATDSTGNVTDVTNVYTVTGGGGSTGTATAGTAPASGVTITIIDDPEQSQETDYVDNDAFPAAAHEGALDKLTRLIKRLSNRFGRTLRTADGDPITDLTLGSVDARKGKFLFFNAITGAIEYALSLGTTVISQSIIGQLVNPQTDAESSALVTPTDYSVPSHDKVGFVLAARYGFAEDASAAVNLAALQDSLAVKAAIGGGIIMLPPGDFAQVLEFTINSDDTFIVGAGSLSTRINFDPAGTAVCFNFDGGGSSLERVGVIGVGFRSSNSNTKTAVRFEDCRDFKAHDIVIPSGDWAGAASIGIHTLGRDTFDFHKIHILCARPLVMDANPNHATLDCDHFHFHDYEMGSTETAGIVFEIAGGVHLTNVTWDGYGAILLGKHGIFYDDTTAAIDSYNVKVSGVRTEGATDATGYSVYLASTAQDIKALTFENCNFDSGRNGIYLRKPECVSLRDCFFPGGAGRTNLDITFQSKTLLQIVNTEIPAASTVTLTNAVRAWGAPQNTGTEIVPKSAIYRYDEGYASDPVNLVSQKSQSFGDMRFFPWSQTMADDAQINLPVRAVDGMDSALVFVGAYGATGPVKASAMVHFTPAGSDIVSFDGSVVNTNTDGNLCILDGGSGALSIINRLGTSVKLSSFTFFAN